MTTSDPRSDEAIKPAKSDDGTTIVVIVIILMVLLGFASGVFAAVKTRKYSHQEQRTADEAAPRAVVSTQGAPPQIVPPENIGLAVVTNNDGYDDDGTWLGEATIFRAQQSAPPGLRQTSPPAFMAGQNQQEQQPEFSGIICCVDDDFDLPTRR